MKLKAAMMLLPLFFATTGTTVILSQNTPKLAVHKIALSDHRRPRTTPRRTHRRTNRITLILPFV